MSKFADPLGFFLPKNPDKYYVLHNKLHTDYLFKILKYRSVVTAETVNMGVKVMQTLSLLHG